MIDITQQQELFIDIAKKLPRKIIVYAIGGTAMMFLGLKEATKDVDLVFTSEDDRKVFKESAKSLGFDEGDVKIVYGKKDNVPEMINILDSRLDLFLTKIITSTFSESMKERASEIHEFDKNLIIKIANPNDILVMKAVTSREKDREDILNIINNFNVNWDIIIKESENQIKLGNERAVLDLGTTLEKLKNQNKLPIPPQVLDSLWKMLKDQISSKIKSNIKQKPKTIPKPKNKNKNPKLF